MKLQIDVKIRPRITETVNLRYSLKLQFTTFKNLDFVKNILNECYYLLSTIDDISRLH